MAALLARTPDIIALQEVTTATANMLRPALQDGGLGYIACSLSLDGGRNALGPRAFGVMIASRYPLAKDVSIEMPVCWREKVLSRVIHDGNREIEIHTVHVPPGSSNLWTKVEVLEGVFSGLRLPSVRPRILCGDFNAPQGELPSGEVVTWAQRQDRTGAAITRERFRGGSGARWDKAERNILVGLRQYEMFDVFRTLHGYGAVEGSWFTTRNGRPVARRFDHIFASHTFHPIRCAYIHEWRVGGLSDHSAIEAELEVAEQPGRPASGLTSR